jgi:DNA replication licensing factor MCM6
VEQDDIDFDEEELEGERSGDRRPRVAETAGETSQDVEMSAADMEHTDDTLNESAVVNGALAGSSSGEQISPTRAGDATVAPPAPAQPRRRMIITHDKYIALQSLIVLYLSSVERETGRGMDKDELIDWYLESKENEIQDVEGLEYERELITKMLRKLVKVCGICVIHSVTRLRTSLG